MSLRRLGGVAAAVTAWIVVTPVWAEDYGPYAVRAGSATSLASFGTYNPGTCNHAAIPVLTSAEPPARGEVTFVRDTAVVREGRCQGKTLKSIGVVYRAAAGFRGRVIFTVDDTSEHYMNAPGIRSERHHFTVDIK